MQMKTDYISLALSAFILLGGVIMLLWPSFLVSKPANSTKPVNLKVFRWMGLLFFIIGILGLWRR